MDGIRDFRSAPLEPQWRVPVRGKPPRSLNRHRPKALKPPINRPLAHELPIDHPYHPADPSETWVGLGDVAQIIARRCTPR